MAEIEIKVSGAVARVVRKPAVITAGTVGLTAAFTFDASWDGLAKTAVFSAGNVTKDVVGIGTEPVTVPHEVLAEPMRELLAGVYGVNADGTRATPTIWARVDQIRPGANPSGDESTDPSLPVWGQIMAMVGDLGKLETEAKESLVAAVNELAARSGGDIDPEDVKAIVAECMITAIADWNQNDPAQPDYIKNRPFCTEIGTETIIDALSVKPDIVGFDGLYSVNYWTSVDGSAWVDAFQDGDTLTAEIDGATYECQVVTSPKGLVYLENDVLYVGLPANKSLNFDIMLYANATDLTEEQAAEYQAKTFSLLRSATVFNKIPSEYLPEVDSELDESSTNAVQNQVVTKAVQDLNTKYVKNRTHYEDTIRTTLCENVTPERHYDYGSDVTYFTVPSFGTEESGTYDVVIEDIGTATIATPLSDYTGWTTYAVANTLRSDGVSVGNAKALLYASNGNVWLWLSIDHARSVSVYHNGVELKKLDKKFLPGDLITSPSAATVGQTLIVKAVDENGKPTEWDAVDPWIIQSSTPDSDKKFEITVDDSGTLTATEVT